MDRTQHEAPYTMARVEELTGVPAHQIKYAIIRGELKTTGKVGKAYVLPVEQVELIRSASGLVAIGVVLWLAIRAVRDYGWTQSPNE